MATYYTDLMEMKNDTARKNAIRERIATIVEKAIIQEFGEENTKRMKNTIAAAVGEVENKEGRTMDACVKIDVKVMSWNYTQRKDGNDIDEYNLEEDYQQFLEEQKEKEAKKKSKKTDK